VPATLDWWRLFSDSDRGLTIYIDWPDPYRFSSEFNVVYQEPDRTFSVPRAIFERQGYTAYMKQKGYRRYIFRRKSNVADHRRVVRSFVVFVSIVII
jgi:hypothetical protein